MNLSEERSRASDCILLGDLEISSLILLAYRKKLPATTEQRRNWFLFSQRSVTPRHICNLILVLRFQEVSICGNGVCSWAYQGGLRMTMANSFGTRITTIWALWVKIQGFVDKTLEKMSLFNWFVHRWSLVKDHPVYTVGIFGLAPFSIGRSRKPMSFWRWKFGTALLVFNTDVKKTQNPLLCAERKRRNERKRGRERERATERERKREKEWQSDFHNVAGHKPGHKIVSRVSHARCCRGSRNEAQNV